MRVFLTGATGFIGSAIVQELLGAGHQVTGLARSEASAAALRAAGAQVHSGSLEDSDSLRSGAAAADGVIHAGFIHDFSKFKENCEIDRKAIEVLGEVLAGSQRPLIVTSGIGLLPSGVLGTEASEPAPNGQNPRVASEEAARALAAKGVNVALLRLPPSVHGAGDHGFVPMLINIAREKGEAAYIGNGDNRWSAVHRYDAARLYRLALEKSVPGARWHGVGEEGVPFRQIAEVIGKRLNLPVVSKTPEAAAQYFTWFTHFASFDCPASSAQTQAKLDWHPSEVGLLADIDTDAYFTV